MIELAILSLLGLGFLAGPFPLEMLMGNIGLAEEDENEDADIQTITDDMQQTGSASANDIETHSGHDRIFGRSGEDLITSGARNDAVFAGDDADIVFGQEGNDFLRGGAGEDLLVAGTGSDTLYGDAGDDILFGADILNEMEVAESTRSGELPSFLLTSTYEVGQADTLDGGVGSDTLVAGSNDVVHTGLGNDVVTTGYWMEDGETAHVTDFDRNEDVLVYLYDGENEVPTVEFINGPNDDAQLMIDGSAVLTVEGVDYTQLTPDHVFLTPREVMADPPNSMIKTGTDEANLIELGDGNDKAFGRDGNGRLFGGLGNDSLYGSDDDDLVIGQASDDFLRGGNDDDIIIGGSGNDYIHGDTGQDILIGANLPDEEQWVEARTTGGIPTLTVTTDSEQGDVDTIFGGYGEDTIYAGANDIVDTGEGADTLVTGLWMDGLAAATVVDFDPAEDVLVYQYDPSAPTPVITFKNGPDDNAQMMVDDHATLVIENVDFTTLDTDNVFLMPFA
jgi:Ca2+-binding RTX toxin-like protein